MSLLKDNDNLSSYHGRSDEEEEKEQQVEGYLGKIIAVQIMDQLHIRASIRNVSRTLLQKFSSSEPVGMVNTDFFTMMSIHHQQGWDGSKYNMQPQAFESAELYCSGGESR